MAINKLIELKDLNIDLKNFRTVPQKTEIEAVTAMIAISPDNFWALLESLLESNYLPTENILVIKDGKEPQKLIVKEGNRRIAAMKILHSILKVDDSIIPTVIAKKISEVPSTWLAENLVVPCALYDSNEAAIVDKIITLTHGKGEKASRDKWTSVATARHNRVINKEPEPGLDLLEKYLEQGNNLTPQQKEIWAGEYPLTVLVEGMRKIATRIGLTNSNEIASKYPGFKYRVALEGILSGIGTGQLNFKLIRDEEVDFAEPYGIPPIPKTLPPATTPAQPSPTSPSPTTIPPTTVTPATAAPSTPSAPTAPISSQPVKAPAFAINDPKHLKRTLKKFTPVGHNRAKVVTILEEMRNLKIEKNPIAFCLLLRSIFEISAKAYCNDVSIKILDNKGNDRNLVDLIRDVTIHLTQNNQNMPMIKKLHGATTELARKDGILSVTSMNQLVHSINFSITPTDICTLFGNIFPLLEAMNT